MEPQHRKNGRFVGRTRVPVESPKAFVFLELDRETGQITVDDTFSTPLETWAMLWHACERCDQWKAED